jgi:hypothetical protein
MNVRDVVYVPIFQSWRVPSSYKRMNGLHGHPHGGELHAEEKFLAELCAAAAVPAKPVFLERNVVTVVMNNVAMAAHHHHQQQQQQQVVMSKQ